MTHAPTAQYCITSTNSYVTRSKAGDTITVSITAAGNIEVPTVTCSGISFDVTPSSGQGTSYTATHTVASGDTNVQLACTVSYADYVGNTATASLSSASCVETIGESARCGDRC